MNVSFEFALKFERFCRKNCVSLLPLFFLYLKFILCPKAKSTNSLLFVYKLQMAALIVNYTFSYSVLEANSSTLAAKISILAKNS